MSFPVFVSAGEALTDLLRTGVDSWTSKTGGATWNVARVMAHLGVPSAFAGAISRDVFGADLAAASAVAGLDLRFLQRLDRAPLLAVVHELHPPRYFFIGDDSADLHFDAGLLPAGWQTGARWVHFGGISLARRPLADKLLALAADLAARGVRISYDPNFRAAMTPDYDSTLRTMATLADVIKVSDEDLHGLFRHGDTARAFATLRQMNPRATYLYTRGEHGASLLTPDAAWQAGVPTIDVVDTVGAGDASIASLLYSLMTHPDRGGADHLRFAVAGGAAACLASGAATPDLATIDQLMQHVSAQSIAQPTKQEDAA